MNLAVQSVKTIIYYLNAKNRDSTQQKMKITKCHALCIT